MGTEFSRNNRSCDRRDFCHAGRVMALGLLLGPAVHAADAVQVAREAYTLTGNYEGEINGQFDLGGFVLNIDLKKVSRIRENLSVRINARIKDPRSEKQTDFVISGRYTVMRDLVKLDSFEMTKNGSPVVLEKEDEDEERMLRTYLAMLYLVRQGQGEQRYTVVPGEGEPALFVETRWRQTADGREQAVILGEDRDADTGQMRTKEMARFDLVPDGQGGKRVNGMWMLVIDRASKYLDLDIIPSAAFGAD